MAALRETLDPTPESKALTVVGTLHDGSDTVVLLGPHEPEFWPRFSTSPEYRDGAPDPLDRWSKRIIQALATAWGGRAVFPSDGPPYPAFQRWAQESGEAWQAPVGMLVHVHAGLMISFRGAVRFAGCHPLAKRPAENPCNSCTSQPCLTACPVKALTASLPYDVAACQAHLATPQGQDCLEQGCRVRRACPVSEGFGRLPEQSAFHMKAFL